MHFVRCIKPNSNTSTTTFDDSLVLAQLRSTGNVAFFQLMKCGYPDRMDITMLHKKFGRYFEKDADISTSQFCFQLLRTIKLSQKHFKIGKTDIFFRSGLNVQLDILKENAEGIKELIASSAQRKTKWKVAIFCVIFFESMYSIMNDYNCCDLSHRLLFIYIFRFSAKKKKSDENKSNTVQNKDGNLHDNELKITANEEGSSEYHEAVGNIPLPTEAGAEIPAKRRKTNAAKNAFNDPKNTSEIPANRRRANASKNAFKDVTHTREFRPASDIRFDHKMHYPKYSTHYVRCKLENCPQKSRVYCIKCKVHLCLVEERNCFNSFHGID